jgi:hypothetical protein
VFLHRGFIFVACSDVVRCCGFRQLRISQTVKHFILLLLLLAIAMRNFSQSYNNQQREVIAYNILTSASSAAIGAVINKKKSEKWFPVFVKGFVAGAAGGYLMHQGKRMFYYINEKHSLSYGWPAKLIFSLGESVTENASLNLKPWQTFHINVGFARFEYSPFAERKLGARLLLSELASAIVLARKGRLDIERSMQFGNLVYTSTKDITVGRRRFAGYAWAGAFVINKSYLDTAADYFYSIAAHEAVHTYQANNYIAINAYFRKYSDTLANRSKFYAAVRRNVFLNINGPFTLGLYKLASLQRGTYYANFFEFEAEHYALRRYVPR